MENHELTDKEEEILNKTMSEEELKQRKESLARANQFKPWGGIISYMMKNLTGMRQFVHDELIVNKVPAEAFLERLLVKYPTLTADQIPSLEAVRVFKRKLDKMDDQSWRKMTFTALKDEFRILTALTDINFFQEVRTEMDKCDYALVVAEQELRKAVEFAEKLPVTPPQLWTALDNYLKAIAERHKYVEALDALCIRFGLMPPHEEYMFFDSSKTGFYPTFT